LDESALSSSCLSSPHPTLPPRGEGEGGGKAEKKGVLQNEQPKRKIMIAYPFILSRFMEKRFAKVFDLSLVLTC
jgi:hypothetical protein